MATEIENLVINVESKGIDATSNAINSLTNTLNKIQVASNGASNGAKKTVTAFEKIKLAAQKATKPVKDFFSSFAGKMFSAVGVIALGKALSGAVNKANEYVESYNLFTVALGKYAGEAEAYAQQVSDAMGIDTAEWERAQGTIMTLVTGFGTLESRAYTMSKNLTQLGYDLSSFFNISVGDAMTKIESGIAGELEPLRRLGYDLSQTKLQAVALQLGIKKSVAEMTQAEKAELRYYAIMTQVTTAQGDMARTLNSPANQIRILKAQFEMLTRTIGTIFIPILNKVLPYLIAVAKALRGIAEEIASMAGFSLADVTYDTDGLSDFNDDLQETTESANELKKSLMGFDEINKLSDKTDGVLGTGTGFSFDLPEYDFLGDAIEKKVDSLTNKLKKLSTNLTIAIRDIFFDKDSLDAESVAKKTLTTITTLLGAATGFFLLGGASGALLGATIGLGVGILASSTLFDGDGLLDPNEILTLVLSGLGLVAGAVIGALAVGSITGGVVGATIGLGVGLLVSWASEKLVYSGISTETIQGVFDSICDFLIGGLLGLGLAAATVASGGTLTIPLAILFSASGGIMASLKPFTNLKETFLFICDQIATGWNNTWAKVESVFVLTINKIVDLINIFLESLPKGIKEKFDIEGNVQHLEIKDGKIEKKANGGYVNSGQLFIAREAGAEMVGSMNGHTAVANNDQITDGIYRAVLQAMRESGGGNGNNGNTTFVAQLNGKTLFEEVISQNKKASRMYGKSPLTV